MTRTLLTSVAAGAIFLGAAIAPVAYAQDTTQPAQTMETKPAMPDASAEPATPMASMEKTYLTEQSADQVSANTYIGQSVYNAADESIGSINDLIMEKSGGIAAAVIGVGGFLGIGEKWVAVPFDNIAVNQTEKGDVKLTTTETAESLKAAPEFKTLSQQVADRNAVDTTATSSTTTTTTTTPPPAAEPAK